VPAIRLLVRGRVQGVGFRWFVRVQARRLNLSGWVANRPDGTVEVAALGDQEKLDELKRQLTRGPDGAHVTSLDELDPLDEHEFPFSVRR
jgi:acylphosphatase